ncbi:hypothetical protein TIFTF001_053430 [Ficus carica]|uniref:Uncharacterized protein n=1 Tax=Ficus carica TaxID=3494 RepID=A0AA88EC60_FICCA|nr:hypothetical protein TIFTF001_053430 [Ficus carica]
MAFSGKKVASNNVVQRFWYEEEVGSFSV